MKETVILIALVAGLFSCSSPEKKHKNANHHMHKSSFEELVAKFEDPDRDQWQKPIAVIEKFGDVTNKKIADIGAGTGYFSRKLALSGAQVVAIDIDEKFLKYIEDNSADSLAIETRLVPIDSPLLDSAEVDAVIVVDTYHHIENRFEYFRDVWRGLKPGGQLIIVDFKREDSPNGPPKEMRMAGFDIMKELQKAGFIKVLIDVKTLEFQYIISAKKYDKAT